MAEQAETDRFRGEKRMMGDACQLDTNACTVSVTFRAYRPLHSRSNQPESRHPSPAALNRCPESFELRSVEGLSIPIGQAEAR